MGAGIERIKPTARKILLLLAAGIALGLSRSPRQHIRVLKNFKKDWDSIDNHALHRTVRRLHENNYISYKKDDSGNLKVFLTQKGLNASKRYKIDEVAIPKMKKWDSEWRMVLFDIPEKHKRARNALSRKLKEVGFYKLQKSVFIHPFPCTKEVDFILKYYRVEPYVRLITAKYIDNSEEVKSFFKL